MTEAGEKYLAAADASGASKWPVGYDEWEASAKEALDPAAYDYIAGGAGSEQTMRANREAFYRRRLVPRMMRGTAERDLSVEILGAPSPHPFMLAPVAAQGLAHADAEVATARAAAATRTPMIVSSAASAPMEAIAQAMGDNPRWFQLYWVSDREVVESLVRRAEAAGYSAIVLTVDAPYLGVRDRDLRNHALMAFLGLRGIGQFTSDPVFLSRLAQPPEENPELAGATWAAMFPHATLTWDDIAWLRTITTLPLLAKGILAADDAARAMDAGIDGIVVSNHGGRQVDGSVAALDALPLVRAALPPGFPLLMDSGIRRGSDVLKALALGADCVLIGRPYIWGLAVGGEAGVEEVIRFLAAETDLTLALVGAHTPRELDPTFMVDNG